MVLVNLKKLGVMKWDGPTVFTKDAVINFFSVHSVMWATHLHLL